MNFIPQSWCPQSLYFKNSFSKMTKDTFLFLFSRIWIRNRSRIIYRRRTHFKSSLTSEIFKSWSQTNPGNIPTVSFDLDQMHVKNFILHTDYFSTRMQIVKFFTLQCQINNVNFCFLKTDPYLQNFVDKLK